MFDHSRRVSSARRLRREFARKFAQVGFWGTLKSGIVRLIDETRNLGSSQRHQAHPFDVKYGTDTSGIIEPGSLDIADDKAAHAIRYQTAIVEVFTTILNELSIPHEEFIFVDLGSGKGRALLLASRFPFKQIIGVELSPRLHEIACRNIQIYREELQQCRNVQSVCEDAANFQIPGDKAVFYLFNPFDAQVMGLVLANIENSLRRFPRVIYILYLKPVCRDLFEKASFLRVAKNSDKYVIYEGGPQVFSQETTSSD